MSDAPTWPHLVGVHTPNKDALEHAVILNMFALLSQRRMRWLGHVCRMEEDGHIPNNVLCGELTSGVRHFGRPALRFRDVC